jgi:hypothetical protein
VLHMALSETLRNEHVDRLPEQLGLLVAE